MGKNDGPTRSDKRRVFVIKPLIVGDHDFDLWMDQRDKLLGELHRHGCPAELLTSLEGSGILGGNSPSEPLAEWLQGQLKQLGTGQNAPVRSQKKLPHSKIAAAAVMLLEDQNLEGSKLVELVADLLKLKRPTEERSKEYQARSAAIQILAQLPKIGVRTLSKMLGVNPSTVSRWQHDPAFRAAIEKERKLFKLLEKL